MPLTYLIDIAQTAAPTFQEGKRAELVVRLWTELGYQPQRDSNGNVLLKLESEENRNRPALLLASHLDTVFEINTDITVQQQNDRLIGAGVGDNSASLAILTAFLRDFKKSPFLLKRPLWLSANVAEEGLGDLLGAKALLKEHQNSVGAFVAVDGYLGVAVTQAVGVRRYQATFRGPGGHSWGDQTPSCLQALGLAIAELYRLHLPAQPRTTLNVGQASGGHSVNSIATSAHLLLDLRSLDRQVLEELDQKAQAVLHRVAQDVGVTLHLERVGDRPGGLLKADRLVRLAQTAAREQHFDLRLAASSTDANAAILYDLPAMALGVYRGGNAHREDEWVDRRSLETGLNFLRRFIMLYQNAPVA